jgi:hypothetical protein
VTATVAPDPRGALVRGVRAAVLAVPAVGTAAIAHRSVDSCLELPGVLLALGACWSGAVAVLGARRRMPALVLWLLAAQVSTHVLLQATCTHPGATVPGPHALAAHLLAVVAVAAALHRADSDLWLAHALLRAFRRVLLPVLQAPPVPTGHVTALPTDQHPLPGVPASALVRRGPPSPAHA